jgi:serine/threonine-protein kinase
MSPEQVGGKEVDQQTDIWSLGVVLYEMFTGERPFKGDYEQAVIYAILNEEPKSTITSLCKKLPKELESIVNKCLEKDQTERYDSIRNLADDLAQVQKEILIEKHSTRSFYQFKSFPRYNKRTFNIAMAILLVSVLIALFFKIFMTTNRSVVSHRKMIAVLPFENIGAHEDEYFTDGITEEITSRLAEIRELGVIARTSVMQYKNTEKMIQQIGKELGVEYIIGGTVRWEKSPEGESRIRVTPQLIRVSDATHLWTERYDKVLSNVFKIQSDIAERIVLALNITLLEKEKHLLKEKPTDNLKAYDYYLRGNNYQQRSYTKDDFQTAIKMYEKAIKLDSNFTLAYANLSNLHTDMYWFTHDRSKKRLMLAKKAIDKAVELNPDLPEVRLALGEYYYHGKREYKRALEQYSIALKYMPNNSDLLMNIGIVKKRQGKFEDVLKYFKKAAELNPRSQTLIFETAFTYYNIRKYAEAERYYNQAISLAPDWPTPYHCKALLYLSWLGSTRKAQEVFDEALHRMSAADFISRSQMNSERTLWKIISEEHIKLLKSISLHNFKSEPEKYFLIKAELHDRIQEPQIAITYYDSARQILEKKVRSLPEDDEYLRQLGIVYAGLGLKEKAIQAGIKAVENLPPSKDAIVWTYNVQWLAQIYVMVGEYDAAIEQLELLQTLITSRVTIPWLEVDPTWDPLRDHPRFKKLLKEGK